MAQVYNQLGNTAPDLDHPGDLKALFQAVQLLNEQGLILAYHDRSDGGLFVTLCEMALAGRAGIDISLDGLGVDLHAALFSEELGVVLQVRRENSAAVLQFLRGQGEIGGHVHVIGSLNSRQRVTFSQEGRIVLDLDLMDIQRLWSETSFHMQRLRDNPECALQEYESLQDPQDPGLGVSLSYNPAEDVFAPFVQAGARPRVAILREQGVNGQVEMAAAFDRAGFEAVDVHMSDILAGRTGLNGFKGLVACGGFSYGDVLGAGGGWANSILHNARAREEFARFFQRQDSFTLGVCNGCQMFSRLKELIPGAEGWPVFMRNSSEQFEARLVMVEVLASPSILFAGMAGSRMPIPVAHGEGRAVFPDAYPPMQALAENLVALRYVDNHGRTTVNYPANPNGSPFGITGLTTPDGRVTILMPHPERGFLRKQLSWLPDDYRHEQGPWLRMFENARRWVEN